MDRLRRADARPHGGRRLQGHGRTGRAHRHADLVTGRRTGRGVVYELHEAHVTALLQQVLAHIGRGGPGAGPGPV
ncbi:hypothetical protein [Streptomyces sp. G-G2]|uniref:hypothetical protein n=1 Tax=Streptomyces sp. G-G2 TaxID=3046201 RepID=UPI0024BA5BBF|nr:hypothetical protein [Streptomyces sp. G-G2]MDJ0383121.1 hypothetical protein [Streptomyces sp. G-G2]